MLCQSYVQEYEGFCETTGEPGRPLDYLSSRSRFSSRRRQRHRSMGVHFSSARVAQVKNSGAAGTGPMLFPPAPIDCLGG